MDVNLLTNPIATTSSLGAGTKPQLRGGNMGDLIESSLQARYYENCYRRNIFSAANPTGITATAFVSGTTTVFLGFCLTNPIGSLVNLNILKVGWVCYVPPATACPIALAVGYNAGTAVTQTTALTVRNSFVGVGAAGTGLASSSVTCPTAPNSHIILGVFGTGAVTTAMHVIGLYDIEGCVILPPGAYALVAPLVAAGASGAFGSMTWAEIPL